MKLFPSFKMALGFVVSCKTCVRKECNAGCCKSYYEKQYGYNPHTEHIKYPNVPEHDEVWIGDDEELRRWSCPNWMPNYHKVANLCQKAYMKHIEQERNK